MKIKALVGAAALSALVMSGVAFAQEAGTMAPIPNPPETPKAVSHHHGKHAKKPAAKHHKGKSSKAAAPAAAPAQ